MKFIKKFNQHEPDYVNYINDDNCILPNLSYCKQQNETHLNKFEYSRIYLTFTALESGTISFNIQKTMNTDMITSISYSLDDGNTWITTSNQDNKSENIIISVNVNEGNNILWKGNAKQLGYYDENYYNYIGSFFSSTCQFDAKGNIMSLLYGDNFKNKTTLEYDCSFCCLFFDFIGTGECHLVNAKDLSLPATTLSKHCYQDLFLLCTSLITVPELPATTLTDYCYYEMFKSCTSLNVCPKLPANNMALSCYQNMFYGCIALTTAPELPATTLSESCYAGMFYECESLTNVPNLSAQRLAKNCCDHMFYYCSSLIKAPELPGTILEQGCYINMFQGCYSMVIPPTELPAMTLCIYCYENMFMGCKSLTKTPKLPATTLEYECYQNMFFNCTSLTIAPELPATTLAYGCYQGMFGNCTSLTTAPELPALNLVEYCYNNMFEGCSSLNYIKAMFITTPNNNFTGSWVLNVASTGTFVKNENASWNSFDIDSVPQGWTIETTNA